MHCNDMIAVRWEISAKARRCAPWTKHRIF